MKSSAPTAIARNIGPRSPSGGCIAELLTCAVDGVGFALVAFVVLSLCVVVCGVGLEAVPAPVPGRYMVIVAVPPIVLGCT